MWFYSSPTYWLSYKKSYKLRMMVALCGILVLFIIVFKWPMKPREKPKYQELMVVYQEEIILQPMVITRQNIGVAAPPKPIVQALASEYRLIEEDFLTIERPNLLVDEFEQARNASTGWIGEEQKITGDPDRFARIKKIVEPSYSNEVLASNDQYKIGVEMIVDSSGKVVDAYVSSIEQILDNGESVEMDQVQFGILEAIIEAAFMWEFTPAVKEGKTVKTQRTEFFNFGHADC